MYSVKALLDLELVTENPLPILDFSEALMENDLLIVGQHYALPEQSVSAVLALSLIPDQQTYVQCRCASSIHVVQMSVDQESETLATLQKHFVMVLHSAVPQSTDHFP